MAITKPRKCDVCKEVTFQTYYDDYRPGKPYAYWQCEKCGTCFYKCPVHGTWTGDMASETDECTCSLMEEE
jgi:MinD superfamily P-loop ATPase